MPDKYLDSSGLARYDEKIKEYIAGELAGKMDADGSSEDSGSVDIERGTAAGRGTGRASLHIEDGTGTAPGAEIKYWGPGMTLNCGMGVGVVADLNNGKPFPFAYYNTGVGSRKVVRKFIYPINKSGGTYTLATTDDTRLFAHDILIKFDASHAMLTFRIYTKNAESYTSLVEVVEALTGEQTWQGDRTVFVPMSLTVRERNDIENCRVMLIGCARMSWLGDELQLNYNFVDGGNAYNAVIFADHDHAYLYYGYIYISKDPDYTDIIDNVMEV